MRVGSAWRKLPTPNRRWLVVNALLATALINVIVNAALAWLGTSGQDAVSMWGVPLAETSLFWNVIGTLFLLPLVTCVLTTTIIRRDLRRGALVPLDWSRFSQRRPALPSSRWRRGAVLGALATAFAVILGILVTPPIAFCAMADPHPESGPAA